MTEPSKITLGEKVELEHIESEFRKYWRNAVDEKKSEALLKASTLNLIIYIEEASRYDRVLADIDEVISHHPGRVIVAYVNKEDDRQDIDAHISVYFREFKEGQAQISAEVVVLETGNPGKAHLPGAILPLLLPDLPVFFWCTASCVLVENSFKIVFQYTDRLIVDTPHEYQSKEQFSEILSNVLSLKDECKVSDLTWSELTDWREAVAQFFDTEKNQDYLSAIEEVEIDYSGEHLTNHAFLIAGWLASALQNVSLRQSYEDESTIYYRRTSKGFDLKLNKKRVKGVRGLHKIKIIAQPANKTVIFTVVAMKNGTVQTNVQIGGTRYSPNYFRLSQLSDAQRLCNELDFLQQDDIYLRACSNIQEYLHES